MEVKEDLSQEAAFIQLRRDENATASQAADNGQLLTTNQGILSLLKTRILNPTVQAQALKNLKPKK